MKLPNCNKKQAPQINEALSVTIDEADEEMEIVLDDSYNEAKPRRNKNDFTIRCLKVTISLLIMFIIVLFGALVRRDAQKSMQPIETGTSSEQSQYFDDQPTSDQEQAEAEDEDLALDYGLLYVSNTSLSESSSSFLDSNNTAALTTTAAPSPDDKDNYLDNTTATTTTTTTEQTSPLAPLATIAGLSEGENDNENDNDYFRGCLPDRFDNEEMDLTVDPRYNFNRLRPGQFICSKPYRYKPDQPDVVPQRYRFGVTLEGDVVWMDTVVNETVVVFENPGTGDDVSFTLQTDATMVYHHPSAAPAEASLAADYLSHPVSHTPLCLSNHDCPYFHIHQGGVLVLNYIAADGEGWQAKNFLRAYGI